MELEEDLFRLHEEWQETVPRQYAYLVEKLLPDSLMAFAWLNESLAVVGTFPTKEDEEEGKVPMLLLLEPESDREPVATYKFTSEVNKVRVLTLGVGRRRKDYIAALCENGEVYVIPVGGQPVLLTRTHTNGGFALEWSPSGLLAIASGPNTPEGFLDVWDINFRTLEGRRVHLLCRFDQDHTVNAICWIGKLLIAGTEDGRIVVYKDGACLADTVCHSQSINHIAASRFSTKMIATVTGDGAIHIWHLDEVWTRRSRTEGPPKPLWDFEGYGGEINAIQFSPHSEGLFATGTSSGQVILWDLANVGKTMRIDDERKIKLEAFYSHSGHIMGVCDLAWHPTRPRIIGSVSEDCRIQVWSPHVMRQYGITATIVTGTAVDRVYYDGYTPEVPPLDASMYE